MTDSDNNFALIEKYFDELIECNEKVQNTKISDLIQQGILNKQQAKSLKSILKADKNTQLETNVQSVSGELLTEINTSELSHEQKQIGPYLIEETIGEGGMGHVYLARRNDGEFNQQVAIKLPHFNIDKQTLLRFENEREILAQLTHPNIAHLLDGGTAQDNQPYLVMEYVKGTNIDQYCIDNIPSLKQRIKLIIQICSAVSFAHQKFVLHRDLKPNNILVTGSGQVKLLDFGIAKLFTPEDQTLANKTATQIMTRNYASPEQIQGKMVGTHSDLFSLAVVAYELITGFHPFKNKNQHEREKNLVSGKILSVSSLTSEKPLFPALSKISISKIQGDLENILLKALSTEPEKRYSSVPAFADDLQRFIDNKPVKARKQSFFYSIRKLIQRQKIATFSLFFTSLILIFATGFSIHKAKIAYEQKQISEIESENSKQIADFIQKLFERAVPVAGKEEVMVQDVLDQAIEQLKSNNQLKAENKYHLMYVIFRSFAMLNKFSNLRKAIAGTYQSCLTELSESSRQCQKILVYKAHLEHVTGNDELAVNYYQQAEDIERKNIPVDQHYLFIILRNSFSCMMNVGALDDVLSKTEEAMLIYKNDTNKNPYFIKYILSDLAFLAMELKDTEKALKYIQEIDELVIKYDKQNTLDEIKVWALRAAYNNSTHHPQESAVYYEEMIQKLFELYPVKPVEYGIYMKYYGNLLSRTGDIEKTIQVNQEALKYFQNQSTGLIYKQIDLYVNIALAHLLNNVTDKAQLSLNAAENLGIKNLSDDELSQCKYKLANARLSIAIESTQVAQTQINKVEKCSKLDLKSKNIFLSNWHILNAQLALKNQNHNKARESLKSSEFIFKLYPEDYLGLKHLFDSLMQQLTAIKLS